MRSSTKRQTSATAVLWAAVFVLAVVASGCAEMRDPESSDLPWGGQTHEWELAPGIPSSLRGN